MTLLQTFARGIARTLGFSPASDAPLANGDASPAETLPAASLWPTYVFAVKDVFHGQAVHIAAVRCENECGEEYRCVGQEVGIEAAFDLATQACRDFSMIHGEPRYKFLFFAGDGDLIARVSFTGENFASEVIDWITPRMLEKHRRAARSLRATHANHPHRTTQRG